MVEPVPTQTALRQQQLDALELRARDPAKFPVEAGIWDLITQVRTQVIAEIADAIHEHNPPHDALWPGLDEAEKLVRGLA